MFGKLSVLLLTMVSVSLPACAQPKYENVILSNPTPGAGLDTGKLTDCTLKFKSGNCLTWMWEKQPTSSEQGILVFKIFRANALDNTPVPVEPEFMPSLLLWMPSMGHGSSPTTVEQVDTGSYRATNVFFVMPGAWQLKFQIKNGQTVIDEVVVDISI